MGSNDVIAVHQSVLGSCVCSSADVTSLPDPYDVVRNLLSGFYDYKRLRHIPSREFKPWYGKCKLLLCPIIPLASPDRLRSIVATATNSPQKNSPPQRIKSPPEATTSNES